MLSIARLQDYLRQNAQKQYERVNLPPFSLFFHVNDPLPYFNYAIPDEPISEVDQAIWDKLRAEFIRRERQPRFEFIEEFAPALSAILQAHQFVEEARQWGMVCNTRPTNSATVLPGLVIVPLESTSPLNIAKSFVAVQHQGFGDDAPITDSQAQQFLNDLHDGQAFLAELHGQPVGVGLYTSPQDGLTEMASVATLPEFRRRGIGTAIIREIVGAAFSRGVEAVCLTAADEAAGQLYARSGFRLFATMLAYS